MDGSLEKDAGSESTLEQLYTFAPWIDEAPTRFQKMRMRTEEEVKAVEMALYNMKSTAEDNSTKNNETGSSAAFVTISEIGRKRTRQNKRRQTDR